MPPPGTDPSVLRFTFGGDAAKLCSSLRCSALREGEKQAVKARVGVADALLSYTNASDDGEVVMLGDLLASIKEEGHPCAGNIDRRHSHVLLHCTVTAQTSSAPVNWQAMQPQLFSDQPRAAVQWQGAED